METKTLKKQLTDQRALDLRAQMPAYLRKVRIKEVYIVDILHEHRLASIAERFYGNTNNIDVIQQFNNIKDITNIPEGTALLIPELSSFQTVVSESQNTVYIQPTVNAKKSNASIVTARITKKTTRAANVVRSNGRLIYGAGTTKG